MQEAPTQELPSSTSPCLQDWRLLGLLVLLVLPIRGWLFYNTEVTARDSVGYIRYALTFERKAWHEVWRGNDQHPGYPMAIYAVSQPVRWWFGTSPETLQRSAQLVSLLASFLLLFPTYYLGKHLLGPAAGFGGALLFNYWPVSAHHLADGISETQFLLLLTTSLLLGVQALARPAAWRWALCGLTCGLGYLTRPEAALVVPALGIVMLGQQLYRDHRVAWGKLAVSALCLGLSAGAIASVYVGATGRITNKISALKIIHHLLSPREGSKSVEPEARESGGAGGLFAASYPPSVRRSERAVQSGRALATEITHGFHYVGGMPVLLGLWWAWPNLRRQPAAWMLFAYAAIHAAVLVALAMAVCYVSDRHTMPLVLLGSYLAAYALIEAPRRLKLAAPTAAPWYRAAALQSALLFAVLIAICLPKTTQRLHANRVAHHRAGQWLAEHRKLGDIVLDDHGWTVLYSGLLQEEGRERAVPRDVQPTCYVVITRSNDADVGQGRTLSEADIVRAKGQLVYHFPEAVPPAQARLVVYAQPRDPVSNPWLKR